MKAPANGGPLRNSLSGRSTAGRRGRDRTARPARRDWRSGQTRRAVVPELIIAGIGIVWSLVLTGGVWIELSAVAGVIDNLLRRNLRCGHCRHEGQSSQERISSRVFSLE